MPPVNDIASVALNRIQPGSVEKRETLKPHENASFDRDTNLFTKRETPLPYFNLVV
jgi:hypothetical protein